MYSIQNRFESGFFLVYIPYSNFVWNMGYSKRSDISKGIDSPPFMIF